MDWTFSKIWNESIDSRQDRPIAPRNRIWASELGKPFIEIYLKLIGEIPTNPPNNRAIRKFEAGNLFEWIVKLILIRCGIYQESQKWIGYVMPHCLQVSGKLDHIAGGMPKYDEAAKLIDDLMLPESFTRATKAILEHFKKEYPNGLEEKILEIKSVSSFGFDKAEATGKPMTGHDLQAFHYAYNEKKNAAIVYICRDDLRLMEIFIDWQDPILLEKYQKKIKEITDWYNKKEMPPIEPAILFDEDMGKFTKNFGAEYSAYLTKLYGVKDQLEFDEKYSPSVERWNRVLGRIKEGKEMTDNNNQALAEMSAAGHNIELIKSKL